MLAAVETPQIASVEAEAALCGALLLENRLIDQVADKLAPEDFSEALMGRLFAAIVSEYSKGRQANVITIAPFFVDDDAMKAMGGPRQVLPQLTHDASVIGARDFAEQIHSLSRRRKLIEGLRLASAEAHKPDVEIEEVVSFTEETLADVAEDQKDSTQLSAAQCVSRVLDGFNDRQSGVSSGILPIDAGLGPILPKQLVIMAGRPSMGKSAVASSYGLGAASRGHGVLFVSLEMSAEELGERIASDMCFDSPVQVPYSCITDRRVTPDQSMEIARAFQRLEDMPLQIVDVATASLSRLNALVRRHARRMKAKGQKLELVIVDYLQLVKGDSKHGRYEEVSEVSRGLKALAKANNVGVLALAQLSRKVEERHDKKPLMADLRDSGQIEQDADAIMFLYREEYYLAQCEPPAASTQRVAWQDKMDAAQGKIEFITAKVRRRRTGTSIGRFYGAFQAVRA